MTPTEDLPQARNYRILIEDIFKTIHWFRDVSNIRGDSK